MKRISRVGLGLMSIVLGACAGAGPVTGFALNFRNTGAPTSSSYLRPGSFSASNGSAMWLGPSYGGTARGLTHPPGNEFMWSYNGFQWHRDTAQNVPGSANFDISSRVVYYEASESAVAFTSSQVLGARGKTWILRGSVWHIAAVPLNPPALAYPAIAYDGSTREVIMVGGAVPNPRRL